MALYRGDEVVVAAGREHGQVKAVVGFVDAAQIAAVDMAAIDAMDVHELVDQRRARRQRDQQRGLALKQFAHLVDLPDLVGHEAPHHRALLRSRVTMPSSSSW
jgi:hypothetical protein